MLFWMTVLFEVGALHMVAAALFEQQQFLERQHSRTTWLNGVVARPGAWLKGRWLNGHAHWKGGPPQQTMAHPQLTWCSSLATHWPARQAGR